MSMLEIYKIFSEILPEDISEIIIKSLCILTMKIELESKGINSSMI